jgi:hypothetical protein
VKSIGVVVVGRIDCTSSRRGGVKSIGVVVVGRIDCTSRAGGV